MFSLGCVQCAHLGNPQLQRGSDSAMLLVAWAILASDDFVAWERLRQTGGRLAGGDAGKFQRTNRSVMASQFAET